jgi:GNAT superfamily N-acetyltransferase
MVVDQFATPSIVVRPAALADAEAIADLHVRVWRRAYRDLATPEAYAALTQEVRARRWRQELAEASPRRLTLLAELDGGLLGFGTACAPTEAVFGDRGEIRWLHVGTPGRGVGRRLMGALAAALRDWGYQGCALGVVVGNEPAMAFYDRLGGRRAGVFVDPGPLWRSENVVFVWDDLAGLLDPAAA